MKMADDNDEDPRLEAPGKLVNALRRSQPEPVFVPRTVDEAVLRAARKHLTKEPKACFRWFSLMSWIAGAAAVLVAAALVFVHFQPRANRARPSVFAREDLTHDGRVDILDAFAMARQLKQGIISDLRLDVNGDGVADERDVQFIAVEAVKLSKGGRS